MGEARPGLFFPHGSYAYVIQAVTQESGSRLTNCQEWTVDSNRQKKKKISKTMVLKHGGSEESHGACLQENVQGLSFMISVHSSTMSHRK